MSNLIAAFNQTRCRAKNRAKCPYHGTPFAIDERDVLSMTKNIPVTAGTPVYSWDDVLSPSADANIVDRLSGYVAVQEFGQTPRNNEVLAALHLDESLSVALLPAISNRDQVLNQIKSDLQDVHRAADYGTTVPEKEMLRQAGEILGARKLEIETTIQQASAVMDKYPALKASFTEKDYGPLGAGYRAYDRASRAQAQLVGLKAALTRVENYESNVGRGLGRKKLDSIDAVFA